MSNWLSETLRNVVSDLDAIETDSGSNISLEVADGYLWRIKMVYRDLLAKEAAGGLRDAERDVQLVASAHS